MILFPIEVFWKFVIVRNWTILEIWCVLKLRNLENSYNFRNCKFFELATLQILEFSKLKIFLIFQIRSFWIVQIGKWRNFEILFNLENQCLVPKIGNFGIIRPFDIPHYSQFCQFSYLPFDINKFRRFNL